jgi:hypothetical protein
MRSGMGVSDAFKAWVLKRFPGERGAGGASVLSTRGAEAYMSRGLCDYFVTVGSRRAFDGTAVIEATTPDLITALPPMSSPGSPST